MKKQKNITPKDLKKWNGLMRTKIFLLRGKYGGLSEIPTSLQIGFSIVGKTQKKVITLSITGTDDKPVEFEHGFVSFEIEDPPENPKIFFKKLEQLGREVARLQKPEETPLAEPIRE